MPCPVVHFAVYADDPERAIAFYREVFGWSFEPWGPPGYWKIATGGHAGITEGALSRRTRPMGEGAANAFRSTISVVDLDATLAAVVEHGGRVHSAVADIPDIGRVAEIKDPEGNLLCAMQYAPTDPRYAGR